MKEQLVSIREIADDYGKRPQSIHKIVNRLGINVVKVKSDKSRGQVASHITTDDYEDLKGHLKGSDSLGANTLTDDSSVFYIIQLEPKLDPGRVKVGFTTDISERIKSHRTSAPFSKIVRTWPCKLLWERTAIECVTHNCEQLHTEIFRTADINELINRAESFFELMPPLHNISNHNDT